MKSLLLLIVYQKMFGYARGLQKKIPFQDEPERGNHVRNSARRMSRIEDGHPSD
jgi:hypothetical protein